MTTNTPPVPGRYYVENTPSKVTLDVTPLIENNVHDILDLLSSEFFEDFVTIAAADPTGQHDGHAPDRLAFEELKDQIVARLSTRVGMTGTQAVRVGERVAALGRQLVAEELASPVPSAPVQRSRRSSWRNRRSS